MMVKAANTGLLVCAEARDGADSEAEPTVRKDRIYSIGILALLIHVDHQPSSGANMERV